MNEKKTQVTKGVVVEDISNEEKQAHVNLGWQRAEEQLGIILMLSAGVIPLDMPEVAKILRGVCGLVAFETELRIARRN